MEVRSIKIISGEEIVGDIVTTTADGYHVKNPLVLHLMKGQDGVPTIAFAQYSLVHKLDAVVVFPETSVSCRPVEVMDEVEQSYVQNTSSIFLPPPASSKQILHG